MTLRFLRKLSSAFLVTTVIAVLTAVSLPAYQTGKDSQIGENEQLARADASFEKGAYSKAIEDYLAVSQTAKSKMSLSRAYMGLALSHFYLRDAVQSESWIRKVIEVDPKKEISSFFYPVSFVDLFNKVKKAGQEKQAETAVPSVPAPEKKESVKPVTAEKPVPVIQQPVVSESVRPAPEAADLRSRNGKWEFEVHGSSWSVNPVKSLFEDDLKEEVAEEISDLITKQVGGYSGFPREDLENSLAFDSSGSNYGFGVRFYPGGRKGVMSIGLSYEKTKMKVLLTGQIRQDFADGSYGLVDAMGTFESSPSAVHLSFRWDFAPSWRVTPYMALGIGAATFSGNGLYSYQGDYVAGSQSQSIEGSETKTLKEVGEDMDIDLPDKILLVQMCFGLKGEVYKGIFVNAEAGFWNGMIFRGGLSYRF